MHGSEFLWSTAVGCNFSFILVPSWVNFSNRYMYGWSKIVHRGTWMGLTSYTVVHGWVTFPSKLVHGWVMGGGTSKFPEAHPYPDQSWVPPPPPGICLYYTGSLLLVVVVVLVTMMIVPFNCMILSSFFFFFPPYFIWVFIQNFRCRPNHLFSHEAQGRNVLNSLTVGIGFHDIAPSITSKQWEVAIRNLINTSIHQFRIFKMDNWLNFNKRPYLDSIRDHFASEANP